MKQFYGLSTFFLILILSSNSYSQSKKIEKFADYYLEVAFWTIQENSQPIIKWSDNIDTLKYKVEGNFTFMSEKSWNKYLEEIKSLTGKTFVSTNGNDYHILIYVGELNDFAARAKIEIPFLAIQKFGTWSSRKMDNDYNLTKASFCIVPSKLTEANHGKFFSKIAIIMSLGILGRLDNDYSIFQGYPTSSNSRLTRFDKRFIKLHYNEAIKSGSNKESTRQTILNLNNIEMLSKEKL